MSEETYEGVTRSKISCGPQIDYSKCISCGKCVVFCRGYEDMCPAGAITHPSKEETKKIIDKLKEKVGK